jgi:hypothetical protein
MKEGAANMTDALLPPEDGAITRALSDLKVKLSTWSTAVANVQGALAAQVANLAEMDSAEALRKKGEHRESEAGANERDAALSVAEPIESSPVAQNDGYQSQEQEYVEDASLEYAPGDGSTAAALSLPDQIEESDDIEQEPADEDQALLESLDEKMAESIRVQFRLFDGRKSIRELIDAYEETPEEPQKSKSWWRRAKG